MITQLKKWLRTYLPYLLTSVCVIGPLWLPGYVLTMDMVFVPHPPIPSEVNASLPLYAALHYLSYMIPGDILQKILLLSILLLAGIGMDRLLRQLYDDKLSRWAVVAASLFYMTSAFVYERLIMGQWAVVAGYALLPFVVVALLRFLAVPRWHRLWWLVGWTLLLTVMSIHTLLPAAIMGALFIVPERRRWRLYVGKLLAGAAVFIVLSSYWLLPALLGNTIIGAALRGNGNSQAFSSHGGVVALLRLQGMWGEAYHLFTLPQQATFLPGVWQTLLWLAVIIGFISLWRRNRKLASLGAVLIIVGCLIAWVGIGPMYREPHKIMVLTNLGMAILAAAGVNTWLERLKRIRPALVLSGGLFACTVPLLLGAVMLWGLHGQLGARDYPPEWYTLDRYLQGLPDDKPAVFTPWHLYQRYSFAPRITANPAPSFFEGRRIIVSDDPELAGTEPLRPSELTTAVGRLLAEQPPTLATELHRLGVGYIIAAREPGYEDYTFLGNTPGLRVVFNEGRLTLYKIEAAS